MFGKFSEQMTKSAQPVANIMEMNARMLELMSKQQTLLFTGLMDDSVKLVENLTTQSELKGMLAAQSVFAESIRERVTGASKTTYTELTSISAEMTKGGLTTVDKPQAATASTPKATAVSAPKKASTKDIAKTATVKKAVAKKAPAKKPAVTAKSNAPKAVVVESKVADKPVAKTVSNVTPADVKASVKK